MVLVLAQYLLNFPMELIEKLMALDATYGNKNRHNENTDYETMLAQFKSFQTLNLDDMIVELYSIVNPLYYSKDTSSLSKLKLQEVMIYTANSNQILFHNSFCYVRLGNNTLEQIREIVF